jgi:rod shape-determining protein MreC
MESFFVRYRNPLLLVALVLLQVILLASQIRRSVPGSTDGAQVRLVRLWVEGTESPFESLLHGIGHGVRSTWSNYFALRGVKKDNDQLKAEIDRLRLEQAAMAEDARQGQRLQALLDFKQHYLASTVAAQVIGTSGTDLSRVLYVDKGSRDGVKPDMPVITRDGIVGKVREVLGPHTAQLLLINDQTSGAGVLLEKTRIRGVLRGNTYGQLEVVNVMPDDRIQAGESIIASGGDQIFPRGYPVGKVDKVQRDPAHDPYVQVLVTPSANLSRLEEVLIVTGQSQTQPGNVAEDIATSEALAEQQKKAAEVMAEKLPTVKPEQMEADGLSPALHQPPPAIHPDRFTTGATPAASAMQPGVTPTATVPVAAAPKAKAESSDAAAGLDAPHPAPPVKKLKTPAEKPPAQKAPADQSSPGAAAAPAPAATVNP